MLPSDATTPFACRLAALRRLRGPTIPDFASRLREVVVVASSSRGGSSMLAELFRRSPALLHLRAEFNPFLRLVGLTYPERAGSDRLDADDLRLLSPERRRILDEELALDAGRPCDTIDDDERFALDAAWRFTVQWPALDFDVADWTAAALRVLTKLRQEHEWGPDELRDPPVFQLMLLREMGCLDGELDGHRISPWYYDLPGSLLRSVEPRPGALGSPGDVLVEEPPFVLPRVWRRADEQDLASKPLVIKTPSNAYRLGFLRALFPNARLRVVHLTRNPAASINGLIDGWRHNGFHSHRLAEPLRIRGYADDHPDDRWWWKFDLPPGWEAYTDATLAEVCAFQWNSAHRAVLDDLAGGDIEYVRVRFEDLIRDIPTRVRTLAELSDRLAIPFDGTFRKAAHQGVQPVVATAPPTPRRWYARSETIKAAVGPEVLTMARRLGYGTEDAWI